MKTRLSLTIGDDSFFLNADKTAFTRKTLAQKLKRLGRGLALDLSPHMLRRYFVTSNVNKGISLMHLKIAAGHSDISTTQGYCMTSVDEVVEAMRGW